MGTIHCPDGHYFCDLCHSRDVMESIIGIISKSKSGDPFEIAELCMALPGLPMLGCEHAWIAGGALASAIKNSTGKISEDGITEIFARTRNQARGGYCGLTGVCGIVPAIGAVFAILNGSKCGTNREQKLTMECVVEISKSIASITGPSCCKAYVRKSLETAARLLRVQGIVLQGENKTRCLHSERHPHGCRKNLCPYFGGTINGR